MIQETIKPSSVNRKPWLSSRLDFKGARSLRRSVVVCQEFPLRLGGLPDSMVNRILRSRFEEERRNYEKTKEHPKVPNSGLDGVAKRVRIRVCRRPPGDVMIQSPER